MISELHIKNYKSVKDLSITPKRINLLIGEHNSGKSNILEALSWFSVNAFDKEYFSQIFRFKNIGDFFYNFDGTQMIEVSTDSLNLKIRFAKNSTSAILNLFEAHQASIGDVCNFLKKSELSFAIIDEDLKSSRPKYLSEFAVAVEKYSIRVLKNSTLTKTILVLRPRLEEWIYEQCQISKINPKDFQFPPTDREFKAVINKRLVPYGKMVDSLIENRNPGIAYLKVHLTNS